MVFDFLYAVESLSLICLAAWNILSPLKGFFFLTFKGSILQEYMAQNLKKLVVVCLGK